MVDKQAIMDQIKIMVMAYSLRSMANELDKSYSTLSNELDERDWAKLGFRTVLTMLGLCLEQGAPEQSRTAALKALDIMEEGFGRVGYAIPDVTGSMTDALRLMASMSLEYAESVEAMALAMDDGQFEPTEIAGCRKENRDLLKACLRIEGWLNRLETGK